MVANFPGPYEVEINYTIAGLSHKMRINCDVVGVVTPGDAATSITLATRDTLGIGLNAAVVAYVTALQPLFSTEATFFDYTFWKYTPLTFERTFITSSSLNLSGTSASPTQQAHQLIDVFRTQEGGTMRVYLLEGISASKIRIPYSSLSVQHQTFVDSYLANNSWMLGRDTSYPITFSGTLGSENEKLFRLRYRQ